MTIPIPCILAPFLGSEIAGGAAAGTISVVVNGVREALPFPAAGGLTLDGFYYVANDGLAADLAAMLLTAINVHSEGPNLTIADDSAGLLTGAADLAVTIEGAHANTTLDLTVWGLDNLGDHVLGPAATAFPFRHRRGWFPGAFQATDSRERARMVGGIARPVTGLPRAVVLPVGPRERELGWQAVDPHLVRTDDAAASAPWSAFETTWEEAIVAGYPWRFYQDATVRGAAAFRLYELGQFPRDGWPWRRNADNAYFYDLVLVGVRNGP